MPSRSEHPQSIKEIFDNFKARRSAIIRALTTDVDKFYPLCDPKKENLCLFGQSNGSWEVNLPAEEVPAELPEPALGINFARDGMDRKDWLSLVAIHSDCWLISVAFYYGAGLNSSRRKLLFTEINKLPTVFEVIKQTKPNEDRPAVDNGSKSTGKAKGSSSVEDEEGAYSCGYCCVKYSSDEFWICCDACENWFHGKCVNITSVEAEGIQNYNCPSCMPKGRQ
ncbi:hypothetical protein V2J09_010456 [Rumex salicifolius]